MYSRKIDAAERPEIPPLSILFGYGPMAPIAAGAAAAWLLPSEQRAIITTLTVVYAASILAFVAAVQRGVSFRTEGGPQVSQIATMLSLYSLTLTSLVAESFGFGRLAIGLALTGFLLVAILDPIAAWHGTAPLFFVRLRPTQMTIAVLSLAALMFAVGRVAEPVTGPRLER